MRRTLPHHHGAHEDLNGPDSLQWDLALSSRLIQAQFVAELVLGHGIGVVDLVSEDDERDLGELLHGQKGVEFGLGLGQTLVVHGVD